MSTIAEKLGMALPEDTPEMVEARSEILHRWVRRGARSGQPLFCRKANGKPEYRTRYNAVQAEREYRALPNHKPGKVYPCGDHFHISTWID